MASHRGEIVLGIGGGIAAYKSCDLLRRLRDRGYGVTVVPTPASLNFVGTATWEALSGRTVTTSVFEDVDQVRHVDLAKNATAILIAPATADLIARIASGRADDLLTNTVLAAHSPIIIVPAMHPAMWSNAATQSNVSLLRERGMIVMEPSDGALTSGDHGKGRFPDTAQILDFFEMATPAQDLIGKKILVTAGGTREPIDPVRYIGNHSSGLQGISIAIACAQRGADVTLVLANAEKPHHPRIKTLAVKTASEMLTQCENAFGESDILFMAAAIADARPKNVSDSKIKKGAYSSIELVENPDLLEIISREKRNQVIVAFAAETAQNAVEEAHRKLVKKNADLIYLNNVAGGAIFGERNTSGSIIDKHGNIDTVVDISKEKLAQLLVEKAIDKLG